MYISRDHPSMKTLQSLLEANYISFSSGRRNSLESITAERRAISPQ